MSWGRAIRVDSDGLDHYTLFLQCLDYFVTKIATLPFEREVKLVLVFLYFRLPKAGIPVHSDLRVFLTYTESLPRDKRRSDFQILQTRRSGV